MTSGPLRALAAAFALLATASLSAANNVTIDDMAPQWTYTPVNLWGSISKDNPCTTCAVNPDPSKTNAGTWHDLSSVGTAMLSVPVAQAITIYTICPGPLTGGGAYVLNVSFILDGAPAGEFHGQTGGCPVITYNYPIFSVKNLALKSHTLQILNHITNVQFPDSDLLVDYAIIDDGTPQSATSTGTASHSGTASPQAGSTGTFPVAAVVVPIIVVLLIAAAIAFWFLRRRRLAARDKGLEPTPYAPDLESRPFDSTAATGGWSTGAPLSVMAPAASTMYTNVNASIHPDDVTENTTMIPGVHDPQLEAALAIIADRAARSNGSVINVSTAQAQARRPEKSTYRSGSNAGGGGSGSGSGAGPALQRTPSLAPSSSASHSRALSTSSVDPVAPPSYMDTISPRH